MGPLHPPKFGPDWKKELVQEPRLAWYNLGW